MRFSVVIPTYQRRETVARMVSALERQSLRDFEAVVAVDGATDGTASALRDLDVSFPLSVLELDKGGAALARNEGAAVATGDFLLFLDDDMEAHPAMLSEHERSHREGAEVVLGHLPLHPDSPTTLLSQGVGRWAERRRERLAEPDTEVPVTELNTGQMSVSRAAFQRLGGFDATFTRQGLYGGEDLDFGHRARQTGLQIVFNPGAISHQLYVVDPADYTRRTREAGRSNEELAAKHPELSGQLTAGLRFTSRRSRILLGGLSRAPAVLSWPLRALACHLVRSGRLDFHSYRLFFGVQTMEYQRGARQARSKHASDRVVALGYHAIGDLSDDRVLAKRSVPRERFAEQLDGLARRGWSFVDLEAVLQALDGKRRLPRRAALVTFDDAYADLLDEGIPVLAERGIPAVVFAVAGKVGGTNDWDRHLGAGVLELLDAKGLLAVARNGIEIGSHAMTHRVLPSVPPDELDDELRGSADALEALGIARPRVLAYPYGEWSPEVAEGARAAGYSVAFTITPGVVRPGVHRYLLPRVEVFAFDTPRILRLKVATAGWREHWRKRVLRWLRAQR